jgi:uncharacterized protein (TIGR03086 family)
MPRVSIASTCISTGNPSIVARMCTSVVSAGPDPGPLIVDDREHARIGPMPQPGGRVAGGAWGAYPTNRRPRCGTRPIPPPVPTGHDLVVPGNPSVPDRSGVDIARLIQLGRDREAAGLGAAVHGVSRTPGSYEGATTGEPMEPLDQLDTLGPMLAGVVGNITADQLDRPTPCAQFTVRDVLDHMVGGATAFAAAFRGTAPADPPAGDPLDAFGPALGDLAAAMHEPGALDRTIQAPFGEVEGEAFARFVVLDGLVHGWDLATATGQDYDPPAGLVAEVSAFASGALDGLRDGQTFATETEPPADATPIERLVAYTGRTVAR